MHFEALDEKARKNLHASLEAAAEAQVKRFEAAGAVLVLFDADGLALTVVIHPDESPVSRQEMALAVADTAEQLGAETPDAILPVTA